LHESISTPPLAIPSTSEGVAQLGHFIVAASFLVPGSRGSPARGHRAAIPGGPILAGDSAGRVKYSYRRRTIPA
jgi:hypothetical protein